MAQRPNKVTLSIPLELKRKARAKAIAQGTTLSAVVRDFLEKWLEEDPPKSEEKEP
jgi:hypothetical protein